MNYQLLKAKWANCKLCDLCEGRKHVVNIRGHIPSNILFIGEAPGDSEDVLGKPFVGPAGKMLDSMISIALENTSGYYDTKPTMAFINTVGCIPKANGNKVGEPRPDQMRACYPRLASLLRMCLPATGILVGKVSQDWVKENIDDIRSLHPLLKDTVFLDLTHPASILKSNITQRGLLYQKALADLTEHFTAHFLPF